MHSLGIDPLSVVWLPQAVFCLLLCHQQLECQSAYLTHCKLRLTAAQAHLQGPSLLAPADTFFHCSILSAISRALDPVVSAPVSPLQEL